MRSSLGISAIVGFNLAMILTERKRFCIESLEINQKEMYLDSIKIGAHIFMVFTSPFAKQNLTIHLCFKRDPAFIPCHFRGKGCC